jgi:hypothetical protein
MKRLESMHKGQEDAKKKQLDAKKMLLKIDSEEAEERTSRAIEKMEREIKRVMEDIQRKVERAKDSGDKEKLESLKQEAEVQIKLLEYEKKKFEEELKEADEHAEQLASLLLSAEFADDYEEWISAYKESLEIVTLREPKNNFSKDIGTVQAVFASIKLIMKASRQTTNRCESGGYFRDERQRTRHLGENMQEGRFCCRRRPLRRL